MSQLSQSLRTDRIRQLRLRDVFGVEPSASIEQAVQLMAGRRIGCVLVMSDRKLLGIFTEADFVNRVVAQSLDVSLPVEQVMTASPKTISIDASVGSAVALMGVDGYRHLPVVDEDSQPVGVLSVKDIVHYLVQYFPAKVYNLPPTPRQAQPAREGA